MEKDNGEIADEIFNEMEVNKMESKEEAQKEVVADNNLLQFSIEGKSKKELWQHIRKIAVAKKNLTAQIKKLQAERKSIGDLSKKIRATVTKKE